MGTDWITIDREPERPTTPRTNYTLDTTLAPADPEPAPAPPPVTIQRQAAAPTPRRELIRAPLSRDAIYQASPIFWGALGFLAFVYSSISTITQTARLLELMKLAPPPAVVLAIGAAVVVVIFAGELVTSDHGGPVYLAFLAVDVAFTLSWSWTAFHNLAQATGAAGWPAAVLAGVIGGAISVFCAWLPERVLAGRRRRLRGSYVQ